MGAQKMYRYSVRYRAVTDTLRRQTTESNIQPECAVSCAPHSIANQCYCVSLSILLDDTVSLPLMITSHDVCFSLSCTFVDFQDFISFIDELSDINHLYFSLKSHNLFFGIMTARTAKRHTNEDDFRLYQTLALV